jgi:hypothetical protein
MRRPSKASSPKLAADSQRLISFAQGVMQASSRIEERAWERNLDGLLQKLLKNNHQDTIDAALDHAFNAQSGAYDALMESVEAGSESCIIEQDGTAYDALLIAVPILAWTRFAIPSGSIAAEMLITLSAHLNAHVMAPGIRLAMAPTLFAIDQLPRTHAETFALTHQMAHAALKGSSLRPLTNPAETAPFLADTRYLLAVAVAPVGQPLFCWQSTLNPGGREDALTQWKAQALPNITRLLPGCGIELLLPEAYFVACREADKQIRPASLRAAVHYLTHTLSIEPNSLQAVIGDFGEASSGSRVDEYRIGFSLHQNRDILYGMVWPLYGQENDEKPDDAMVVGAGAARGAPSKTPLEEILMLLRESGVVHIKHHEGCFAMESCEDCGAPFYLDMDAELVHAEMPDETQPGATHFH